MSWLLFDFNRYFGAYVRFAGGDDPACQAMRTGAIVGPERVRYTKPVALAIRTRRMHMSALFTLVLILSVIAMIFSVIWYAFEAFSESILWGLAYLFLPFVGLLFAIFHWDRARSPFLLWIAGFIGYVISLGVVG